MCRPHSQGLFDRNNGAFASINVNNVKNIFHQTPRCFGLRPTREPFGQRVEQRHPPFNIRGHHCVTNRIECYVKPFLTDLQRVIGLLKFNVDDLLVLQQVLGRHGQRILDPLLGFTIGQADQHKGERHHQYADNDDHHEHMAHIRPDLGLTEVQSILLYLQISTDPGTDTVHQRFTLKSTNPRQHGRHIILTAQFNIAQQILQQGIYPGN